jgi:hypothetical protein
MDNPKPETLLLLLELALDEIGRLRSRLDYYRHRNEERTNPEAADAIATAYKGELELTAELLGVDNIATIRDEIRTLQRQSGAGEQVLAAWDYFLKDGGDVRLALSHQIERLRIALASPAQP